MNKSDHWYDQDGKSCHEIVGKNGKLRKTTIKDAREHGYFPSVTTVLGILEKPQLTTWKMRQVAMTALKKQWSPGGIIDDSVADAIIDEAFKQVQDAADLGTDIHAAIEFHFLGQPYPPALAVHVRAVDAWAKANSVTFQEHELRLVNKTFGYAGTTDAVAWRDDGKIGIIDFKSRKTLAGKPVTPWETQPMQIAAYHEAKFDGMDGDIFGCNVFISTTEPGRIEACWYDKAQLIREWNAFASCLAMWKHLKSYWPGLTSTVNAVDPYALAR